ncbi:MAG: hypothetical protein IK106_04965 [Clostridiales bacterium]|nr:hypothetical protein [Clostridiales bacterium]
MPTCKYCGNETGGKPFCQNCGAKVEETPVAPQPIPVESTPSYEPAQAPVPTNPTFYTPGGAGGLLAGNILTLIVSVILCCLCFTFGSIAMSIIGIVFAAKVKNAANADQEGSYRKVALIMLILSIVVIILSIVWFVISVYQQYGGFEGFIDAIKESYESILESMNNK